MACSMTATEAMALSAIEDDPPVGTVMRWKGCLAEIVAGKDGAEHRQVVATGGDAERFVLTRSSPGQSRAELDDLELPSIAHAVLWWGATEERRVIAWVALTDEQEVAATVVAHSIGRGWSADQLLPLGNPFPQVMTMHRGDRQRIVSCMKRLVTLVERAASDVFQC